MSYINVYSILIIVLLIFIGLAYSGIALIFFYDNGYIRSRRFFLPNFKNDIYKYFNEKNIYESFEREGLKLSFPKYYKKYQIIRHIIILLIICIFAIQSTKALFSLAFIIVIFAIYALSAARLKLGRHWTVFGIIMKRLNDELKKKQDKELSSIIIQLQNIAISQVNNPTTLTYMLSRVVGFANYSKEAFLKFIFYIDQGDENKAKQAFIEEINTSLAKDLVYILVELDRINPAEVINQLKVLEHRVQNENITVKNQKEETISNLLYIVPTLLCFIILINFLIIILYYVSEFAKQI